MSNKIKGAKRIYKLNKTKGELHHEGLLKQAKAFCVSHNFGIPKHLGSKSNRKLALYR